MRYFLSISYIAVLYIFLVVVLAISFYWIKKKKDIFSALLITITAIAIDLVLFNFFLYDKVLLKRKHATQKFDEYPTQCLFSKERIPNLISEDDFNNFRPTLYKKITALNNYTLEEDFYKTSKISVVYVLLNNASNTYSFSSELDSLNIKQFIRYGFNNLYQWSLTDRILFLNILRAVTEGFDKKKEFYSLYIDANRTTGRLTEAIGCDPSVLIAQNNDDKIKGIEQAISVLFEMVSEPLFEYKNKNYFIAIVGDPQERRAENNQSAEKTRKFYDFLYTNLTARQYLNFLFENEHRPGQIFVLLKDYYDFIESQTTFKGFMRYGVLLDDNLKAKMGVGSPIIKYYSSVCFLPREKILEEFKGINKQKEDVLYLEPNSVTDISEGPSKFTNNFLYTVLEYNPNRLSLIYSASERGYLYYSDCYDTYWNAYIDGRSAKIYKANIAFKAIKIPAGRHSVDFIYNPKFFRISLWFYYVTFGICVIYLILGALKNLTVNNKAHA